MCDKRAGDVIVSSIPTKLAMEQMVSYLMSILKNAPRGHIEKKIHQLPVTLFRNLDEGKGRKIVSDLIKMGVIARFEDPHAPPMPMEDFHDFFYEDESVVTLRGRAGVLLDHAREKMVSYSHMLRDKSKEIYLKLHGNT